MQAAGPPAQKGTLMNDAQAPGPDLLDALQERGYLPQDGSPAGEDWFDRIAGTATVRVVLAVTSGEATLVVLAAGTAVEWQARFDGNTPATVILAALTAAETAATAG